MIELLPGDLILVKGNGWIDKEIELISNSPYSHLAGFVKDNELIEANGLRKTGYQPIHTYSGIADVYRCPNLRDDQLAIIMKYVNREIGGRYDYLLILWEAIRYLTHILLPYKETKSRICSTLWSDAYLAAGIDLCGVKYPSPGDISKSNKLVKIGSI
jgi:hypothetical protein